MLVFPRLISFESEMGKTTARREAAGLQASNGLGSARSKRHSAERKTRSSRSGACDGADRVITDKKAPQ
jgi:hypothetical protein